MSADSYRIAFWWMVVLVLAAHGFLMWDASNINRLEARVAALESNR